MGFDNTHHLAHIAHGFGAGIGDGLLNQLLDLGLGEGGGQEVLDNSYLGNFHLGQFHTACTLVLGDGVAALLDHLVEQAEHTLVIDLDSLVHFDTFYLCQDQAHRAEALFVLVAHGIFHCICQLLF